MAFRDLVQAPDLPVLEHRSPTADAGDLQLTGALVERPADGPVRARRLKVSESELRGLVLEAGNVPGLTLTDVVLRECGMSNVDGRGGLIRRVEVHRSQMVGFGASGGEVRDLRVIDSSLQIASFAHAELQNVVFERVNLAEASFMGARLDGVAFVDCRLLGADFRGAKLKGCEIRGTSLDGVVGIESLRGVRMPWPDVLASAAALAAALGIAVEDG